MNLLRVSWRNLWHKPFSTAVSVLLMTLGVAMVALVLHLGEQVEGQFTKNLAGIDMVVGAKGSPKQLILSSIYHIDAPTGNISKSETDKILRHPMVKKAIPLAYGDSYKGYKILGTNQDYLEHFGAELSSGKQFDKNLEVVLGARAAERLGLGVGGHFHGTHGMEEADTEHAHEEHSYQVVGVLKESGLAIDQLILCNIGSVWQIHEDEDHRHEEHEEEYTAVLVSFTSPMGMMMLPRLINEQSKLQAALPSIEINSLIHQMGLGIETLRLIALLIIVISGISVFFSLLSALKERKYELAIMRSLGAHPLQLVLLVVYEALLISIVSSIIGIVTSRGLLMVLSNYLDENYHYYFDKWHLLPEEYWLVGLTVLIGIAASLIPSFIAFRTNISKTLAED